MAITIELQPEAELRLVSEAERRGIGATDLARKLIEEALTPGPERTTLGPDEAEALLDRLAVEDGLDIILPVDANSRSYYYQNHD